MGWWGGGSENVLGSDEMQCCFDSIIEEKESHYRENGERQWEHSRLTAGHSTRYTYGLRIINESTRDISVLNARSRARIQRSESVLLLNYFYKI